MNWYVSALESRLTPDASLFLDEIYAPKVVAAPPSNAWNSMCVTEDGEIRIYGVLPTEKEGEDVTGICGYLPPDRHFLCVYLSSVDCGVSWQLRKADPKALGRSFRNPKTGRWFNTNYGYECDRSAHRFKICYSDIGPEDTNYHTVYVPGDSVCHREPLFLEKKDRIIIPCQCPDEDRKVPNDNHACMCISDDNGESWHFSHLQPADRFVPVPPHEGPRWENPGIEPSVAELSDGTLVCMLRTSTDYHYISYSHDHGDSWTKPVPTSFHSVLTQPLLFRLNDGRLLWFYNNTKPLPEQDKTKVFPPLGRGDQLGFWEDVFTNRDANCVCISEDEGKTFVGFREIGLNELRNTCDFRTSGGNALSADKSVHQYQAIELPHNKILVHYGQHELVTRAVIFDLNWLYEQSRSNDLQRGMGDFSTQVFLKSISGGIDGRYAGHCSWNRTDGVIPVPDPCGDRSEVLFMRNTADPMLFNHRQGIVWNFPMAKKGEVRLRMNVLGAGARISLLDFWMNPCDWTVADFAPFSFVAERELFEGDFRDLTLRFDTEAGVCNIYIEETLVKTLSLNAPVPFGLCYLHLSTATAEGDTEGTLIKRFDMKGE